jgi:hypothetical protein
MAEYITAIRTDKGNLPIAYDSLYGKPDIVTPSSLAKTGQIADASAVYTQINGINDKIKNMPDMASIKINNKSFSSGSLTLSASDVGAAPASHTHKMSEIADGTIPISKGGTGATTGSDGLKNLLATGPMILKSGKQYGTQAQFDALKDEGTAQIGQIFFVRVQ